MSPTPPLSPEREAEARASNQKYQQYLARAQPPHDPSQPAVYLAEVLAQLDHERAAFAARDQELCAAFAAREQQVRQVLAGLLMPSCVEGTTPIDKAYATGVNESRSVQNTRIRNAAAALGLELSL